MALAVRIISYILAAFMIFMGVQKFIGDVPIFDIIAANTGIGFVSPAFTYITGIMELAAAGLLIAGQRFLGGGLSTMITGGAAFAHLTVLGVSTPEAAFPEGVTAETFQCGVDGVTCSPFLFILALVFLGVSALVTLASRPS